MFETPLAISYSPTNKLLFCHIACYFFFGYRNQQLFPNCFDPSFFVLLKDSSLLHQFHPTGDIDSFISSALWTPFNFARQLVFGCYSLTLTNSNRPSQLGTQSTWTDHFLFLILPTWPIGSTHALAPFARLTWLREHGSVHFR